MIPRLSAFVLLTLSVACGSDASTTSSPDAAIDGAQPDAVASVDAARDLTTLTDTPATDAPRDLVAPADAPPVDAPACPTSMPFRRDACPARDQLCFYSCGTVFRCTAIGWDYATDVDGGPPCP